MPSHSQSPTNSLSQLVRNIFSDNYSNNIMLAAIVSLLLVILFVLFLHVYAKLFLPHSNPNRRRSPVTVSGVLDPSNFHTIIIGDPQICTKGLDSAIVSAIPMIVHKAEEAEELECVICLSVVEEGEVLRILPKCQHVFHVECIDRWLSSHCNCPICRAAVVSQNDSQLGSTDENGVVEVVAGNSGYEIRESERGDEYEGYGSDSVSESSSFLLGCALKRMLSKVFSVSELDGSH